MEKIEKIDWFTNFLCKQNFWVGGTEPKLSSNSPSKVTQTLRYFRGNNNDFLVVPIFEFMEGKNQSKNYKNFAIKATDFIPFEFGFILLIWPTEKEEKRFAVVWKNKYFDNLDTNKTLQFFSNFDNSLVGKSSYLKPLNKGPTDFFHIWARQFLKGFQNDIDAFITFENTVYMVELKRPKENVTSWKPYSNDKQNYITFGEFCEINKFKLLNIAYSKNILWKIKIFKNVRFIENSLSYEQKTVDLKNSDKIVDFLNSTDYQKERSFR